MGQVALYARVSSQEQVEGFSLDAQLRAMRQMAEERGWVVYKEYVDDGYSATTDDREAFQAMIKDAKSHLFNHIIVHKFDRFSRKREHAIAYKTLLKRIGINVYSVSEPTDPNSVESVLL